MTDCKKGKEQQQRRKNTVDFPLAGPTLQECLSYKTKGNNTATHHRGGGGGEGEGGEKGGNLLRKLGC